MSHEHPFCVMQVATDHIQPELTCIVEGVVLRGTGATSVPPNTIIWRGYLGGVRAIP